MQNENQGCMTYEQCEGFKKLSYAAFSAGKISEAQHFIDWIEAHWHRQRHRCPFPEYASHYVRAALRTGRVPIQAIAEYPPAMGIIKMAPGTTFYEPEGVPKNALAWAVYCVRDSLAEAARGIQEELAWNARNAKKKKACAVSAVAGLWMVNPTTNRA